MFTYSSFQNRKVLSGIDCFEQFVRAHQETTTHGRVSVASNIRDWCPPILKLIYLTTMLCSLLKAVFTKLQRAMERGFKTQYEWLFETCQLLKNAFLAFWVPHPLSPLQIFESIVFFSGCFSHFKQQWMLVKRSLFGNKVSGSVKDWQMFHLANSIS